MRKYLAEFIGTFLLVAVVVGSGTMAENLSEGNDAVALLGNAIATGAILFVIIKMFGSRSGAHFNPAVSLMFFFRKELNGKSFIIYSLLQILGGLIGIVAIHYIFELDIIQLSNKVRGSNGALLISEILATTGLILTILFIRKSDESSIAIGVALFITAGYWFTSSTSFANPAVLFARIFTNTFTGIAPESVLYFFIGQLVGSLLAYYCFKIFDKSKLI